MTTKKEEEELHFILVSFFFFDTHNHNNNNRIGYVISLYPVPIVRRQSEESIFRTSEQFVIVCVCIGKRERGLLYRDMMMYVLLFVCVCGPAVEWEPIARCPKMPTIELDADDANRRPLQL